MVNIVQFQEIDEIHFDAYARIEHVITGFWLHALRGKIYIYITLGLFVKLLIRGDI